MICCNTHLIMTWSLSRGWIGYETTKKQKKRDTFHFTHLQSITSKNLCKWCGLGKVKRHPICILDVRACLVDHRFYVCCHLFREEYSPITILLVGPMINRMDRFSGRFNFIKPTYIHNTTIYPLKTPSLCKTEPFS